MGRQTLLALSPNSRILFSERLASLLCSTRQIEWQPSGSASSYNLSGGLRMIDIISPEVTRSSALVENERR